MLDKSEEGKVIELIGRRSASQKMEKLNLSATKGERNKTIGKLFRFWGKEIYKQESVC